MYKLIILLMMFSSTLLADFSINELSSDYIAELKHTGVISDSMPINPEHLRIVKIEHVDFAGNVKDGEIVVHGAIAKTVLALFKDLLAVGFMIDKVVPMEKYNGDDLLSMQDNNTSCFNDRDIEGETRKSIHSYGLAIDFNPVQNPVVYIDEDSGVAKFFPINGIKYANRLQSKPKNGLRPGMIEQVSNIISKHGFVVSGLHWDTSIDYMHFQTTRQTSDLLASMNVSEGEEYFNIAKEYYNQYAQHIEDAIKSNPTYVNAKESSSLVDFYTKEKAKFFSLVRKMRVSYLA